MGGPSAQREAGFTLMETLMAAGLIAIVFASIIPLYIGLTNYETNNKLTAEANSIATREMEHIRAAPYEDVGLADSNPAGVFVPDRDVSGNNGSAFHVAIRVWWIDDSLDGTGAAGTDALPNDYKRARVTVTKPGDDKIMAQLTSNIARESEEPPSSGGNIIVKTLDSGGTMPVSDVRVDVSAGSSSHLTNWTDDEGVSLFAELAPSVNPGDYSISVSKTGYVVRLDQTVQTTTVTLGQTRTVTFIIDQPGSLVIRLLESDGEQIQTQSTVTLSNAEIGDVEYANSAGYFEILELLPGDYDLYAHAAGYNATETPMPAEVSKGQTTSIDMVLHPVPTGRLSLHVYDETTRQKLGVTDVELVNSSTNETIKAQTNSTGDIEINLEVAVYTVTVTAAGYVAYETNLSVIEGETVTHNAYLEGYPTTGSIRVRAESRSHRPLSSIEVRVTGNGYDGKGMTNQSGEFVFYDLMPGNYTVYRWGGNGWRYPRQTMVTAGIERTIIYSF